MIEKIDIDQSTKDRIIDKAGEITKVTVASMDACAPGTFAGICEAFRSEGVQFFPAEMQEIITQGMIGLQGGIGMTGVGTCGAVSAASFLISHVVGVTPDELKADVNRNYAIAVPIVEYVVDRFEEEYGSIDCLRLRYNRVQRAFDRLDPDARMWEMLFGMYQKDKCAAMMGYRGACDICPVVRAARYAAEAMCDLLQMEPEQRKEIPPHLRALSQAEITPKIAELVRELKKLGFGRPGENISYRDYWTFKHKGKKGLEEKRLGLTSAPPAEDCEEPRDARRAPTRQQR